VADITIFVVQLSEAFGGFWHDLAADLGVDVRHLDVGDTPPGSQEAAAILLAAGGAERDALDWLETHDVRTLGPVFAVGADPGRRITAQLVGRGAKDYFALPNDVELLRNTLASVIYRRRQNLRTVAGAVDLARVDAFSEIIGESPALKKVLSRAARLLPHANATALILGETGTGKELLARAIHAGGPRRGGPFVAVNCSALPANLVESEFFGHEKGAFTDAHAAKPGLLEVADGGTLFLDEVGELPLGMQAKLLRVLEDREVRRVGGTKSRKVDVRIMAATNDNLESAAKSGAFRRDLFFRLSVVTLVLPPLRERGDDAILIAQALLESLAKRHNLPLPTLPAQLHRTLGAYRWPGNVRQLRNSVERAMLLAAPGELCLEELLPEPTAEPVSDDGSRSQLPFPARLDEIMRAAASGTVQFCDGNRSEAARRLGISRRRLRRLLNQSNAEIGEEEPAVLTPATA
jgi:two-component system response regulator HydG